MLSLKEGILLEDSLQILRWGSSRSEAWRTGKPTHYNLKDDDTRIKWEEPMLEGLPCGLLAWLPDSAQLDLVTLWLRYPENTYPRDAFYQYCSFFDHFLRWIGVPKMQPREGSLYAPILTWQHDDCHLKLFTGERFGDFTTLEIRKKPLFDALESAGEGT